MSEHFVNKREAAQFFGISVQSIDGWFLKGAPVVDRDAHGKIKTLDLAELARWKIFQAGEGSELEGERTRLTKWQADKTELEVAVLRGELIPSEVVAKVWANQIISCRSRLMSIPTKSAHAVLGAVNAAEAEAVLKKLVNEALDELSTYDAKQYGLQGDEGSGEAMGAASGNDGEPVGGRKPKIKPRGKRGAGPLEH